ncbi:MAG TPA: TCR/Tet family MFS transporter [Bacteroidia bacterium]|nr:TCR/Tet family MFS transporter [Bacteroidia bacterium]
MKTKNPILFVFITVLIDCIGIGIIFPVAATIVTEVSHVSINEATTYSGWMMTCYALMQFLFSPFLGGISDRFGRRPVLLISLLGLGIDYLFLTFANTLPLLFLGRIIAGVCGASFTTAFACIADVSEPEKRAQNFGLMGAAFGLGFIIGPVIGGIFSEYGSRAPFVAAAALSLINFLYGFFILPETLKPENKRSFDIKRANPFGAFIQLKRSKHIRTLIFGMFMLYLAGQVMPAIWPFYTKFVYHWTDKQIGYSLGFVGVMISIVQGGLIKFTQKKFGSEKAIYIGLTMYFIGLVLFSIANQSWMMYAFTFIYALGGIAPPAIQGIISGRVPANEQGELQGMTTALNSISTILSPLIMTNLFYQFTKANAPVYFPGAAFAAAAILICVGAYFVVKGLKLKPN